METTNGPTHRLRPTAGDAKWNNFARESLRRSGHGIWPGGERSQQGLHFRAKQQRLWAAVWQLQDWSFPTAQDEHLAECFFMKRTTQKKKTFLPHWTDTFAIKDSSNVQQVNVKDNLMFLKERSEWKAVLLMTQLHLSNIDDYIHFYIKFIIFCKIVYKQIALFLITFFVYDYFAALPTQLSPLWMKQCFAHTFNNNKKNTLYVCCNVHCSDVSLQLCYQLMMRRPLTEVSDKMVLVGWGLFE